MLRERYAGVTRVVNLLVNAVDVEGSLFRSVEWK